MEPAGEAVVQHRSKPSTEGAHPDLVKKGSKRSQRLIQFPELRNSSTTVNKTLTKVDRTHLRSPRLQAPRRSHARSDDCTAPQVQPTKTLLSPVTQATVTAAVSHAPEARKRQAEFLQQPTQSTNELVASQQPAAEAPQASNGRLTSQTITGSHISHQPSEPPRDVKVSESSQSATYAARDIPKTTSLAKWSLAAGSQSRTLTSQPSKFNHNNIFNIASIGRNKFYSTHQSPGRFNQRPSSMARLTSALNGQLQNPTSHLQGTMGSHQNWQSYTFVDVFIHGLPMQVSTYDLYKNFAQYGEIAKIAISENKQGGLKDHAEVRFKPPPAVPFWKRQRHDFKDSQGAVSTVGIRLSSRQPKHFTVQSPIRPDVTYDEETELEADSIGFGVLTCPGKMVIMRSRPSVENSKVRLILNLRSKEIEVRFPSGESLPHNQKAQDPNGPYQQYPWLRPEYRFRVSFDQNLSISQVQNSENKISFILRLATPPPYAKKLHGKVHGTHVAESPRWLENDVWLRQTSLSNNSKPVAAPISLQTSEGTINIGRWTTFCITFSEAASDVDKFRIVTEALRDFNIKVSNDNDMEIVHPLRPLTPAWDFLDRRPSPSGSVTTSRATQLSLLEEFESVTLHFSVRYLLDVCISNGRLNEYVVGEDFLRALSAAGESKARNRLKDILDLPQNQKLNDPMAIFDNRKYRRILRKEKVPDNCALIHSATVTATTIIFNAPSLEVTNRIIRQHSQYADRFLRVRFEDDKYRGNSRIYSATTNRMDAIFDRVKRTLTNGIVLGDRHYEFLAWGNSQLREHGAYFFASLPGVITASQIRAVMGQFDHEKIIAKRAARMGQCFSTTKPIQLRLPQVTREILIADVERNQYTFTDGVGKISLLLASLIKHQLKIDKQREPDKQRLPSVYQFRIGGSKGVVAVAEDLKGVDLRLRPSQYKFPSEANGLEIIRWSSKENAKLNRQLILVLSALGVEDAVFLRMQAKEVDKLNAAMHSDQVARESLRHDVDANRMTLEVAEMVDNGFRAANEPFVTSLLRLWRAWTLKYLKEKARLGIENGAILLGCVDETGTLRGHYNDDQPRPGATLEEKKSKLPEIFVQVESPPESNKFEVKEGICVITRNPALHEGDIRVVKAVNRPALHHLRDCLVLPQTGDRDLSNMCSGGDLDGDDYIVIWANDEQTGNFDLLPRDWNAEPMDYTAPDPLRAEGDITQNHIIEFFDQYMRNDFLGRIAHAHLSFADDLDEGIRSKQCLELANLHSQAVDFPKTGRPAKLPRALDRFRWPHFMEKKSGERYHSRKILGQLYDKVEKVNFVPNYHASFDERILNAAQPSAKICGEVKELKREYDSAVRRIMAQHEIGTEFEVWSTFVLDHSMASPDFKFHEEIGNLSASLKEEFEEAIVEVAGGKTPEQLVPYAVAAYRLVQKEVSQALKEVPKDTAEKDLHKHMPFMSFPWIMQDTLGRLATVTSNATASKQPAGHASNTNDDENAPLHPSSHSDLCRQNWQGQQYSDPYQCGLASPGDERPVTLGEILEPEFRQEDAMARQSSCHSSLHRSLDDGMPNIAQPSFDEPLLTAPQTPPSLDVQPRTVELDQDAATDLQGIREQLVPVPPTVQQISIHSGNPIRNGQQLHGDGGASDVQAKAVKASHLDESYDALAGVHDRTLRKRHGVSPQPSHEQWDVINKIIDNTQHKETTRDRSELSTNVFEEPFVAPSPTTTLQSAMQPTRRPNDDSMTEIQHYRVATSTEARSPHPNSPSVDLGGHSFTHVAKLGEHGHYMSPFRRRSGQSGSSSSQGGSRKSSLNGLFSSGIGSRDLGVRSAAQGSSLSFLPPPARASIQSQGISSSAAGHSAENVSAANVPPSYKTTPIRTEVDSDDEEVVIYSDPAGMLL